MLTKALAVSLTSFLLAPATGASNDDGRTLPDFHQARTSIDCGHPPRPDCMVDLKVSQSASSNNPESPRRTPPPPPKCHYESLIPQDDATPDLGTNPDEPGLVDIEQEVCPAHGQLVGTPFNLVKSSPQQARSALQVLSDEAYSRMTMPSPRIAMTPAADGLQFVSVPIWLRLAAPSWTPKTLTLTAGGISLTMTAMPTTAVWSMGDGSTVTCHGAGTPYPELKPNDPMAASPDCGYTYSTTSSSRPSGTFPVTVTVHWKVAWSTSSHLSGNEPDLAATASTRLRVAEIQALVTEVRP